MNDSTTTLEALKQEIKKFNRDRNWEQFHSPKNLSMAIAAEAAELMELFLWVESLKSYKETQEKIQEVQNEIADIVILALCFANATDIDLTDAIRKKMIKNAEKYPITLCKGKNKKYTEYK